MKNSASSSNAERALDIMLVLGEVGPEGCSLAEIAKRVGSAKSAVHRTLVAMVAKGFAEPTDRYGHYRLGTAVAMLARRQERLEPQVQSFRPGMTEFARRTGFTVYLLAQSGIDAICAEMISRATRHQFAMGLGARVPMGVGAGSLALMSLLSDSAIDQILDANADRYQAHPSIRPVDRDIIQSQVLDAKRRGYAINPGFFFFGEGGIGLPRAASGMYEVNMAVSFNAPLDMMNDTWIESQVSQLRDCLK